MNEQSELKEQTANMGQNYSRSTYTSFAVMMFGFNAMIIVVTQQYPFFYESLIGLDIGMMFLASIVYTIWDMFNDPFIGHLSDQKTRFTRRWGKRFPWIVGCTIPLLFALVLLFSASLVSSLGSWFLFFWFLFFLSAYDGLLSTILVNYNALLPVKFRSKEERTTLGAFIHLFMMLGPFIGLAIVATLTPDPDSYMMMSIILAIIALISFILSIPGIKEEESIRNAYFREELTQEPFLPKLFSNIKDCFELKPFIVLAIVTLCTTVALALINASQPYYVAYILGIKDTESTEYGQMIATVAFPYVLTTILLIPLYIWIVKKLGHSKAFKYALMLSPLPVLLIFFSLIFGAQASLLFVMLGAALWGVVGGIIVISRIPVQGDFFDLAALKFHERKEGIYLGIWNFFARLVTVIQIGTLYIIHTLTAFDPEAPIQSDPALWGIMAHFGLVPAFFMAFAALVYWKYWDLSPEKIKPIKAELEKIGI
ncbi:MAG: MFS transporter [Candidatus Heimdallarchaeota archaeon]|nr:MAG: MFS transporter [Candidatus Heimdallarchaeota archaeon]